MLYTYNKLVIDKIVSNINRNKDKVATYKILSDHEYIEELNKKLIEEAHEFIEENSLLELADVMEVIESIMRVKNISWDMVHEAQNNKRREKGGFDGKFYLETVSEDRNLQEEDELSKSFRKNL